MIPLLVERYGAQRMSFVLFGFSQILFPLSFIYANDHRIHTIETNLVRGIVSVVLNFGIARYYDMGLDFKYDVNFKNIFKRNLIMVIHGLAITVSQFYLPLPIVHTINFFSPLFVFIIDYFENGVRISRKQLVFLLVSIMGLVSAVNYEQIESLIHLDRKLHSEFKNYVKLTQREFVLAAFGLVVVMFLWAYGLLRVRTYYKNNHTFVNFHLGLMFTAVAGILYPYQVDVKTSNWTLLGAIFFTGLPLALSQLASVAGLALNKKTGEIVVLSGLPVCVGYIVSFVRYGESIQPLQIFGSIMILVGLMGVIYGGKDPLEETVLGVNKLVGDPSKPPVEIMHNVLRLK